MLAYIHAFFSPGTFAPPASVTTFGPGSNAMNWSAISIPADAREDNQPLAGSGLPLDMVSALEIDKVFTKIISRSKFAVEAERAFLYMIDENNEASGACWTRFEEGSQPSRVPRNAGMFC